MISKRRFRMLLSLFLSLLIFGFVSAYLFPTETVGETTDGMLEFFPALPNMGLILFLYGWLILALLVVSIGGLFFFKPWGRDIFLSALILTIPNYFVTVTPASVPRGIDELIGSFTMILCGVLIAVMYLTPVKEFFFEQEEIEEPSLA